MRDPHYYFFQCAALVKTATYVLAL